jgi:ATP-dependent RNA helicase DeaD
LRDPVYLKIAAEPSRAGSAPRVRQTVYVVARSQKIAALGRILDVEDPTAALVFCRTRVEVDELGEKLRAQGYRTEVLHGGMSQEQRDRVMAKLRREAAELVIATDVAARGLDVPQLTHVINYDVPAAPESYVHRIGRVGRAGREGVAITLAEPREHRLMRNIEQLTKQKIATATVPTIADLRTRRLEGISTALREALGDASLESYRVVVDALSGEFEPTRVALAAVKLLFDAAGPEPQEEIAAPPPPPERARERERPAGRGRGARPFRPSAGMTRVFVGGGREMGMRPQDLVGAIAGEAGIAGSEIGVITITDRFSLVEIPDELVDGVVTALQRTRIKGRKLVARREHSLSAPAEAQRTPAASQSRKSETKPAPRKPGGHSPPRRDPRRWGN